MDNRKNVHAQFILDSKRKIFYPPPFDYINWKARLAKSSSGPQ